MELVCAQSDKLSLTGNSLDDLFLFLLFLKSFYVATLLLMGTYRSAVLASAVLPLAGVLGKTWEAKIVTGFLNSHAFIYSVGATKIH